jgi:hypothetical protein
MVIVLGVAGAAVVAEDLELLPQPTTTLAAKATVATPVATCIRL